ncbi:hypothetical protein IP87_21240 [beta proteobacterium AAP121]|nr:hypothetical protein IP80_20565 [beta proteobacterium AAP65]KPF90516.1 hypothetical protein IP87_21240 [beta proteobacterium AAP121]
MKTIDPTSQSAFTTQRPRFLHGLKHRLICSVPAAALSLILGYAGFTLGSAVDLFPALALSIAGVVAFTSPIILTEGWNKPFPPASHLALISVRTQRVLWYLAGSCFVLPALLRIVSKL